MSVPKFQRSIGENVKLDHRRQNELVTWYVPEMDVTPLAEVSKWVLQKMQVVSEVLGVSFDGLEVAAWDLFAELERCSNNKENEKTRKVVKEGRERISQEIKNLSWGPFI